MVSNVDNYINQRKEINIDTITNDFWENMKFAFDNLAPNNPLDNNIISPITQTLKNESWYGEDIVPSRLQDLPEEEQYDESIDKLSIFLGEKLGKSPYKINYLLDQYSGGLGDIVLPMMTQQAENDSEGLSKLIAPLKDKFTVLSLFIVGVIYTLLFPPNLRFPT